jgi:hypothetical protein
MTLFVDRVKKLKEARDSAEEEICIMRQKEEELFQKKLKEVSNI